MDMVGDKNEGSELVAVLTMVQGGGDWRHWGGGQTGAQSWGQGQVCIGKN